MMIVNDNSRVVNKLETSLTDDARVVIYNRHVFRVQVTACEVGFKDKFLCQFMNLLSLVLVICAYLSCPKHFH